jgi:hypothetical protein
MPRKNIFEVVAEVFDVSIELDRMHRLFETLSTVSTYHRMYTLRGYIQKEAFSKWCNRGRCVDLNDFLALLNYDSLWSNARTNVEDLFTLIEIIYNCWYIADRKENASHGSGNSVRDFRLLKKIMDDCLARYNYKAEYFWDMEQLVVIEDKPEATAVAEVVDNETGYNVLRYNHYMLKGDIQAKKSILLALGTNLEPKRNQLQTIDKDLSDGIFYILNNLSLRHNNICEGDKNYRQAVADMDAGTLENWYDELYQMILLAYLQLDQVDRNTRVKALKQAVSPR